MWEWFKDEETCYASKFLFLRRYSFHLLLLYFVSDDNLSLQIHSRSVSRNHGAFPSGESTP